jgi:hypothetical protein
MSGQRWRTFAPACAKPGCRRKGDLLFRGGKFERGRFVGAGDGKSKRRTADSSTQRARQAWVLIISAAVAIIAGIVCIIFIKGMLGIVCGVVVAVLLYLGLSLLLKPEAKLGGIAASLFPNGEAAAARVAEARRLEDELSRMGEQVRDNEVRSEVSELVADIESLASYVEDQPGTYRHLAHFLNVYGEQCASMMRGYLSVEAASSSPALAGARKDAVDGLNALEGVAQGELGRAMNGKVTELSASSDAIKRLMDMDGYQPDARQTAGDSNGN